MKLYNYGFLIRGVYDNRIVYDCEDVFSAIDKIVEGDDCKYSDIHYLNVDEKNHSSISKEIETCIIYISDGLDEEDCECKDIIIGIITIDGGEHFISGITEGFDSSEEELFESCEEMIGWRDYIFTDDTETIFKYDGVEC